MARTVTYGSARKGSMDARKSASSSSPINKPKAKTTEGLKLASTKTKGKPNTKSQSLTSTKNTQCDTPPLSSSSTIKPELKGDLTPNLDLDKSLVLRIIIAKLEASRECDWFDLSEKLGSSSQSKGNGDGANGGRTGAEGKGKNGKNKNELKEAGKITGTELHELYHSKILPALKSGVALWKEDGPIVPSTPQSLVTAMPSVSSTPYKGTKEKAWSTKQKRKHEEEAVGEEEEEVSDIGKKEDMKAESRSSHDEEDEDGSVDIQNREDESDESEYAP